MTRRPAVVVRGEDRATPTAVAAAVPLGLPLNERLVRERDRERARELLRVLTLGVAVLVPLLLHVWQQVAFVETAYRIEELRTQRVRLERRLREVRLERATLESLDRIEAQSRALGLVEPAPEAVVRLRTAPEAAPSGREEDR